MNYLLFLFFFFFIGCASDIVQTVSPDKFYKKDAVFTVNGVTYNGVGVAPKVISYDISITKDKGKIDFLGLYTCHRSIEKEDQGTKVSYTLVPTNVESESGCPLDIGLFDAKGRHSWGYLLFESEKLQLPAKVLCNGETMLAKGVSICQSKIDTIQRLDFGYPVKFASKVGCKITQNGQEFEYRMPKGFCYFSFMDNNGNMHNHTSFGYEDFIIRE